LTRVPALAPAPDLAPPAILPRPRRLFAFGRRRLLFRRRRGRRIPRAPRFGRFRRCVPPLRLLPRAEMIAHQARDDLLRVRVREEPPRERQVPRIHRPARERIREERDDVMLLPRLELARRRELLLDRPDLVREPQDVERPDVLRSDDRDRRPRPP